jgi:serine/threonine-protein kinase RsbT
VVVEADVAMARRAVRTMAASLGFGGRASERIVLAVSELATNLVHYAWAGEIVLTPLERPDGRGLQVEARDAGPGIPDVEQALRDGYSTGGGLGGGLPSVRRLMDEFEISSGPTGTRIVARAWITRPF